MTSEFIVDFFLTLKSFQRVTELLKNLGGLDLIFLDKNGLAVFAKSSFSSKLSNPIVTANKNLLQDSKQPKTNFPLEILEQAAESKQYTIFLDNSRLKKILLPVVIEEAVIGFFYTGENSGIQLNTAQLHAVADFLEDAVEQIVEKDIKYYKEFKGNDLTHQRKVVGRVLEYIGKNYHLAELSLAGVSKNNGISYHYLSRLFKKELKTNFSAYINNLRIEVASRLLKDMSLTVGQVASQCGFEDPAYFCKVFKKNLGLTPVGFRTKQIISQRKSKLNKPSQRLSLKLLAV